MLTAFFGKSVGEASGYVASLISFSEIYLRQGLGYKTSMDFLRQRQDVKKGARVAVGLSGGVDSAVTASILKEAGFSITGVHMQCWDYTAPGCAGNEDRSDAIAVCGQLDIDFKFLNFEDAYRQKVIDKFYSEYQAGRTPNPDALCNREIKFGLFLNWALENGFDYVATGHYARIVYDSSDEDNRYKLLTGLDSGKDQSYFLYLLNQFDLSHSLMPLGGMKKSEVREYAKKNKLVVAEKPESMGICFVGEVDIKEFLKRRIPEKPGAVVLKSTGEVVGKHEGVQFFTVGQRHGFEIDTYLGIPVYVVEKDVVNNILVVGYHEETLVSGFEVSDLSWVSGEEPKNFSISVEYECGVRIRHLGEIHRCVITKNDSKVKCVLKERVFGVAPGQNAVFYKGEELLGGGIII